jgi:cytochrome c peroxidase
MNRTLFIELTLIACCCVGANAAPPGLQFEEVMAGANGDSRAQFIEIKMLGPIDNRWGPQAGETQGRLQLLFYDAHGTQTGQYVFASDPPVGVIDPVHGGYSVLVATGAFSAIPGMPAPDFVLPSRLIMAQDGKVRLTNNPANPNASAISLCLSYGNFVADTCSDTLGQPAGSPAAAMPIVNAGALGRTQNFNNYGTGQYNADFAIHTAAPRNSAGATAGITVASSINQGRNLFLLEPFNGNGRTCSTCHHPDIGFGLSPTKISFMNPSDPLFVAENDPSLSDLENSCLLHGSRGVNLENIDGFANPPVFRGSPNLINLSFTAPFGRSGEFANLQIFATGAVEQHFPKTLARNSNPGSGTLDFRLPTSAELADMEAFMLSIKLPADGNFSLQRMIDAAVARAPASAAAIEHGRALFFGETGSAKCFKCHNGPVFASVDPSLGIGNQSFDTGVSDLFINSSFPDACLGGQPLPPEAGGNRTFSTPQLIGIANTAPYFHSNAIPTLHETVAFYTGPEFNNSPAAANPLIGGISLSNTDVDDLTTFLTALDEPFIDCDSDTTDDRLQLVSGFSDCNGNSILDVCELAGDDCNNNGILDECDFAPMKVDDTITEPTNYGGFFVTAADVDQDNDLDLIVPGWSAFKVQVYLNNSTGTAFTSGGEFPVSTNPRSVSVADFDGDGDPDLVVTNLLSNYVSLLLNNGLNGQNQWLGFAAAIPINMNYGGGPPAGTISSLARDLNNDGNIDLVVCKNFMSQISVVMNLGHSGPTWLGFAAPVDYSTGGGTSVPWFVATGNLNADNYADLVVADRDTDSVLVFINSGTGTFAAPVSYSVQDAPESVAVGDLNGDGKADVVAANTDSDTISVMFGDGTGALGAQQIVTVGSYPFGAQPHSVVLGDVDNDGDLDIVTANKESKNVSVVLNDGQGGFSSMLNMSLATGPDYAILANLNNDPKLDIITAHFGGLGDPSICSIMINQTPAFGGDCNRNGIPDDCDIQSGTCTDVNNNTVPDLCEHLGDLNQDNVVDLLDIGGFVAVLLGQDTNPAHVMSCDINGNGTTNGLDINPFLTLIMSAN